MTVRDVLIQDYCCRDTVYGGMYGTYERKTQNGQNYKPGDKSYTPHGYSVSYQKRTFVQCDWYTKAGTLARHNCTTIGYPPIFRSIDINNVYIKALGKLYGDVKGADFNAAIASAEMNSSLRMIGDTARRLNRALRSLRRGDLRSTYNALAVKAPKGGVSKNTASHWLELQYGWIPLIKDVHEGAKFISHRLSDPDLPRFKVRAEERADGRPKTTDPLYASQTCSQRVQLIYFPSAPLSLPDALGLTDPLSVLWEKLPYSFVVDWFIPIGPWLEAATAARVLQGKVVRTDTLKRYAAGLISDPFINFDGGGGNETKIITMTRTVGNPTPPRVPSFKPLEKVASLQHALNGVALLANLKR